MQTTLNSIYSDYNNLNTASDLYGDNTDLNQADTYGVDVKNNSDVARNRINRRRYGKSFYNKYGNWYNNYTTNDYNSNQNEYSADYDQNGGNDDLD